MPLASTAPTKQATASSETVPTALYPPRPAFPIWSRTLDTSPWGQSRVAGCAATSPASVSTCPRSWSSCRINLDLPFCSPPTLSNSLRTCLSPVWKLSDCEVHNNLNTSLFDATRLGNHVKVLTLQSLNIPPFPPEALTPSRSTSTPSKSALGFVPL